MTTSRRINIQARKRMDWRDPDMPVVRRPFIETAPGHFEQREQIMTPDESQDLAQDSLKDALRPGSAYPDWKRDDLYDAAARLKAKRRRE